MTLQISLFLLLAVCVGGCCTTSRPAAIDLEAELAKSGGNIPTVLTKAREHRVQILISEVTTNTNGEVTLQRHGYRLGAEYFYPASTVKLCGAVAALQELEQLARENKTPDLLFAPMEISPLFPGDPAQVDDTSNRDGGKITVGHEIRKIALVSDNQAFNRLFDLVGHEVLNRRMHALGLKSVVINHRLSESRTIPDPLASAAVTFRASDQVVEVPARKSQLMLTNAANDLFIGSSYWKGETLTAGPMDFSRRNGVTLEDLQDLLVKVVRPDIALASPQLSLTSEHRAFLIRGMSEFPRESSNPVYDPARFPDHCSKFLLPGIRRVFPATAAGERIQVAGKTGQAYGFTIENSYLHNPANGRAIFVSAVIYANSDGILNDDKYDYKTVAKPFMADLGEWAARRWLKTEAR